jgi:hypothetical protein
MSPLRHVESYDPDFSLKRAEEELSQTNPEIAVRESDGNYSADFVQMVGERDMADIREILTAFETGKLAGEKVTINELMTSVDFPQLFYAATEILMKSRIVPTRLVSQNLFETIPYAGNATNVTIRTLGGVEVEEVPEGSRYPETSSAISDQAYRIFLEIKKYGAKVAGTRELLESDNWGIFAYTVRSLADELLNKKETLCAKMLNEMAGHTLKDNANAANVELGSCTGRGIDGAQNGALGIDDIMEILAWMEMRGYLIDTILIHPFAWALWARDTEIREVMMDGGVTYIPQGSAAPGWDPMPWGSLGQPWSKYGGAGTQSLTPAVANAAGTSSWNAIDPMYGKLGIGTGYSWPNLTPFGATYMTTPKHVDRPFKILVTPFVPYYQISGGVATGKYACNIIFADSRKGGLILQKENPTMEEWADIEREINYIKIRERYGMALQDQGRAVAVARNVVVDRTYAFDNVNSVSLSDLTTTSNLV